MKVVAINGSPRKDGNTSQMIALLFEGLRAEGFETEEIRVADTVISGCVDCRACRKDPPMGKCVITSDPFNDWLTRMESADGIVLASPTYVGGMSGQMKLFLDRACRVTRASNSLRRKIGVPLITARRGGPTMVYYGLMAFFAGREMITPCSTYWNYCIGHERGEIMSDQEGLDTVRNLAENLAWTIKKTQGRT